VTHIRLARAPPGRLELNDGTDLMELVCYARDHTDADDEEENCDFSE
jgi:hypothetical protein